MGLASKMAPAVRGLKSLVWQSECGVPLCAPSPHRGRERRGAGRPGALAAAAEAPPPRSPACWGRGSAGRRGWGRGPSWRGWGRVRSRAAGRSRGGRAGLPRVAGELGWAGPGRLCGEPGVRQRLEVAALRRLFQLVTCRPGERRLPRLAVVPPVPAVIAPGWKRFCFIPR